LYYSDSDPRLNVAPGTIWVPPEADEETVLHELGHRYYHFHNNDLSEEAAERYRKTYSPFHREPAHLDGEEHTMRNILIAGVAAVSIAILIRSKKSH
jgi:hypothetical protein